MRKMSLSEWASVAEIVGAIGVVISLVFVVASVNRNTEAITSQVGDASYAAIRDLNLSLLNNPELLDITLRAVTDSESLSEIELERYKVWLHIYLDLWERFYDWNQSGLMRNDPSGWNDYFSAWTRRHVTRELWDQVKWQFTEPGFRDQVELALADE